jgi:hypothetical protein
MTPAEIIAAITPCGHPARWRTVNGLVWVFGHGHGCKRDRSLMSIAWCLGSLREVAGVLVAFGVQRAALCASVALRGVLTPAIEPVDPDRVRVSIGAEWFGLARSCGVDTWRVADAQEAIRGAAVGLVFGLPQCVIAAYDGRPL